MSLLFKQKQLKKNNPERAYKNKRQSRTSSVSQIFEKKLQLRWRMKRWLHMMRSFFFVSNEKKRNVLEKREEKEPHIITAHVDF